jgi:hypothetical protein
MNFHTSLTSINSARSNPVNYDEVEMVAYLTLKEDPPFWNYV